MNHGPEIYLKKLAAYNITPTLAVTGMTITASNGTKIFAQETSVENPKYMVASLNSNMQYGSVVTLRYTATLTNSSLYTDTEKIRLIFYIPKGFDYNVGKESAIGIGANNITSDLTNALSSGFNEIITHKNVNSVSSSLFSDGFKKSIKNTKNKAIVFTLDLKNTNFKLLRNGKINISLEVSKLLGNNLDDDSLYSSEMEILSYKNTSKTRMQYPFATDNSQTTVAIAGNYNDNYTSSLRINLSELDYCKSQNQASIIPPTGKNISKIYIAAISLLSALVLIIFIIKKFK